MCKAAPVPDFAPFAGVWTCSACGRQWPWDAWCRETPVCVCDEDTLSNYAREALDG